ncbi:MAG: hypothetical protein JO250_24265 [Armatimonadetes bacterium]|nr:hypothetical protein [Armatimonadota bacterium]
MPDSPGPPERNGFSALRRLARGATESAQERCDLCGEGLPAEHRHLLDLASRQVLCVCRACAILFHSEAAGRGARRLVPARARLLADFEMTDGQWEDLRIPVNMAFFFRNSAAGRVMALYPSPMGATESLLTLEGWGELEERNPLLRQMEPDVEALLVNRTRTDREYFLAPIDECYKLVGLIRVHWKGLGGGNEVWQEIEGFFARLRERAERVGGR